MPKLKSINPSNYEVLGEAEVSTPKEVAQKVKRARGAQESWRQLGVAGRVALLQRAFEEFRSRKAELVLLEARVMGMPLAEADPDFDGTLDYARWYFDNAQKYLKPEVTFENDQEIHQVFYEPYGVAAVITPWNFPFWKFCLGHFAKFNRRQYHYLQMLRRNSLVWQNY